MKPLASSLWVISASISPDVSNPGFRAITFDQLREAYAEQVRADPVLYAHANRVLHLETNPGNARALVQAHGEGATARGVAIGRARSTRSGISAPARSRHSTPRCSPCAGAAA